MEAKKTIQNAIQNGFYLFYEIQKFYKHSSRQTIHNGMEAVSEYLVNGWTNEWQW